LQKELKEKTEKSTDFSSKEVVKTSQKLDDYIVQVIKKKCS
jgi:hypothetical protein